MKYSLLLLLYLSLSAACTEQVTVVAIEEDEACLRAHGTNKSTMMDGEYGRFKRCGVWGAVGETFKFVR